MSLFAHQNDAGDVDPASCVEDRRPGLGDVAVLIGHIRGRYAKQFVELNREHIWNPPLRDKSQGTDDEIDDEEPEPWRGRMHAAVPLDGPILCHSFLKPPTRPEGWRHGAETKSSRERGERPRDMMYPLNADSGISSSMFRTDFARGPDKKPTPRITPEVRHGAPIRIERGSNTLRRSFGHSETLDQPAKIYLIDSDPECLSFWMWSPTRNAAEQKVFAEHIDAFYDRGNSLDEEYFPDIASAGGSTMAPSRAGYETRTGLTGTEYQIDGKRISNGTFRDVYPVKIIDQPRSNLVMPEQTAIQKRLAEMLEQEPEELRSKPPELELVAKVVRLEGDDSQSKQDFREMLEREAEFVQNHPHLHVNPIYDMAYKLGADDRPWIIEQRQEHCLDDDWLPLPIDKPDMAKQLICGLKHYHDHGHMHRDIKPANVMLQLVAYRAENLDLCRWVAKYTDHGMVASTDRLVKGVFGSHWYCAPEVLDGKRYNGKADIFSLGVLLLCMFAEYDPNRDRSRWCPSSSSEVELWMREEVDRIIEEKCPPENQVLLRGMLLRDPRARWSVDKCLGFVLKLDQSQTRDESSSIALSLPWTTYPFIEEQQEEGRGSKNEMFTRDGVVESGDELSDDASTVTAAAPGPLPDDSRTNVDELDDRILEDDVPATPKLSCAAQLPVTPCPGDIEEDALPSAFCTPVVDDMMTVLAVRQAADQPECYDFSAIWDWGFKIRRSRLPAPRAATSAFARPSQSKPGLQLGIVDWTCGFNLLPQTSRPTKAQQFLPSQQLTKNMTNAIQRAGGEERPKESGRSIPEDYATQMEPPNDDDDSEAETVRLDGDEEPEVPPDARDDNDSEAETVSDVGDREPEATFSSPREAQTNAPTKIDRENEQREAPDDFEPMALLQPAQIPPPSQDRKRKVLGPTQSNNKKKYSFKVYKPVDLGGDHWGGVIR